MSDGIDIVAILPSKKEKLDRLIELLIGMAEKTLANEPGVLRYSIHKELKPDAEGNIDIVMVENYTDEGAQASHLSTSYFADFAKTIEGEGILREPFTLKIVSKIGGFNSR